MEPDFFCPICQGTTLVPTKILIFKDTCWRDKRACLRCTRKLLGLNQNEQGYVCCPLCNLGATKLNFEELKQLQNNQIYQIDKEAMNFLSNKAINGSIEPFLCECGLIYRDQSVLLEHIRTNCPESTRKCQNCNNFYLLKEKDEHERACFSHLMYYSDSDSYPELDPVPQSMQSDSEQNYEEQNSNYLSDNDSISSLDENSKEICLLYLSDYYFYLDKSKDFLLEGRITDAVEFKKKSEDAFSLVIFYRNWIIEKKFRNNWTYEDFLSNLVPI